MKNEYFANRIARLRQRKGISARDMSLSLGQSQSYINSLEKGIYYPSMTLFFEICSFLGVTPKEFFDEETESPMQMKELMNAANRLDGEQLDLIIALAKRLGD